MDLLDYASDSGDDSSPPPSAPTVKRPNRAYLQAAPAVSLTAGRSTALVAAAAPAAGAKRRKQGDLVLLNNPTKSVMNQPIYGPIIAKPSARTTGATEANVAFDETTFGEQRIAFAKSGRALAPDSSGSQVYRTTLGYDEHRLEQFAHTEAERRKRPRPVGDKAEPLVYGSDDEVEHGIWAPPSKEERWERENAVSDVAKYGEEGLTEKQRKERERIAARDRRLGVEQEEREQESAFERIIERKMSHLLPPPSAEPVEATSTFHGDEEFDYKGRSWIAPPAGLAALTADGDLDMDHHRCFVPKKCVYRFSDNDKGVHRIRLFPRTGHLILSGGLDGRCKVWSVAEKKLMRTYSGHAAAVRDVQFNADGSRFVSASFDRYLRLWETETGKALQTFGNKKVPYCVQFYPHDDNLFVVGCSDNKIVTYDCTTGEITQEYNHHLAPVNAILFAEDHGTKMISTSDDKKVLVWEWDIGVPIKYISDPSMHSMPCLAMHPSQGFFCGQSLDNTICVFQAHNRFALQRKKKFSGHVVSGYACELCFSPDGQFLVSGDGNGNLFFWDWKRHRILQKFRAHTKGPATGCVWHPLEPTTMFTCGWDGVIKMWQ